MKYAYHHTSFADHTEKHRIHQHLRDYQIRAIAGIWHEWEKAIIVLSCKVLPAPVNQS